MTTERFSDEDKQEIIRTVIGAFGRVDLLFSDKWSYTEKLFFNDIADKTKICVEQILKELDE